MSTRPVNSTDLDPIVHLSHVLDQQVQSMEGQSLRLQGLKDLLLTSWCQITQHSILLEILWNPGLNGSERFWWHKVEMHNIMQVDLMLWLIYGVGDL